MIKNILYSLLMHSTFAFLIYVNFHHKIIEKIDLKDGLTVGIVSLQDITKPTKVTTKSELVVEKKEKPITKKISKPKIKNKKPIARPLLENKPQFKKAEEEKTEEVVKKIEEEKPEEKIKEVVKKIEEEEVVEAKEEETEKPAEEDVAANVDAINNIEDLESLQLSAREKFNIQSQLRACYKRSLANIPKSNYTAVVTVTILQDGTIDFDSDNIIDAKLYNNPKDTNYKNRMDSILQTLELCSPLRNMPSDKYEIWREFTIEFGAE